MSANLSEDASKAMTAPKISKRELMQSTVVDGVPNNFMSDQYLDVAPMEYSTRALTDYVVSGPLGMELHNPGKGRRFSSGANAEMWARGYYGSRFRRRIQDAERGGRWAMLIAAPKVISEPG